jgi:hypothetical protein
MLRGLQLRAYLVLKESTRRRHIGSRAGGVIMAWRANLAVEATIFELRHAVAEPEGSAVRAARSRRRRGL